MRIYCMWQYLSHSCSLLNLSEFPRKDPQRPDARKENEIYMVKVICDVNNDTWLQMPLSLHHKIMMQSAWELRITHCHPQFIFNKGSLTHASTSKNDFRGEYSRKHVMVSTQNNVVHLLIGITYDYLLYLKWVLQYQFSGKPLCMFQRYKMK